MGWNRSPRSSSPTPDLALPCPCCGSFSRGWLGAGVDVRYEKSPSDQNKDKEEMLAQNHPTVSLVNYYFLLHFLFSVVMSQEFHFAVPQGIISDGQNNLIN